jgi:hypothetical protein
MTPILVVLARRKYNSLSQLDHERFDDYAAFLSASTIVSFLLVKWLARSH